MDEQLNASVLDDIFLPLIERYVLVGTADVKATGKVEIQHRRGDLMLMLNLSVSYLTLVNICFVR